LGGPEYFVRVWELSWVVGAMCSLWGQSSETALEREGGGGGNLWRQVGAPFFGLHASKSSSK
jgi:hypothetical protein